MKAGVGFARGKNAYECGLQAAANAVKSGSINNPSFVLTCTTVDLDLQGYTRGVKSVLGDQTPVAGATAVGVITNEGYSYENGAAAVLVLEGGEAFRSTLVSDIDKDESKAGLRMANQLGVSPDDKLMLLLYDMIKHQSGKNQPLVFNSMLKLLQGIGHKDDFSVPIFGAGLINSQNFGHSTMFLDDYADINSALGIVIKGDFRIYSVSMHGCAPFDGIYHRITKKQDDIILELDGRPAAELIDDIYQSKEWRNELPVKDLTIAQNTGAKYEIFRETNWINRLIPGPSFSGSGIIIPEQDWQIGDEIQFMVRDNEEMLDSAWRNSKKLLRQIFADGFEPVCGIYTDCAGRIATFSNSLYDEAMFVQQAFDELKIPLFGFYSGIELATVDGKCVAQEWTGLLIVITQDAG